MGKPLLPRRHPLLPNLLHSPTPYPHSLLCPQTCCIISLFPLPVFLRSISVPLPQYIRIHRPQTNDCLMALISLDLVWHCSVMEGWNLSVDVPSWMPTPDTVSQLERIETFSRTKRVLGCRILVIYIVMSDFPALVSILLLNWEKASVSHCRYGMAVGSYSQTRKLL